MIRILSRWADETLRNRLASAEAAAIVYRARLANAEQQIAATGEKIADAEERYGRVHELNERNNKARKQLLAESIHLKAAVARLEADNARLAEHVRQLEDAARRTAPPELGEPTRPVYPDTTWGRQGMAMPVDPNPRYAGVRPHSEVDDEIGGRRDYYDGLGD